MRRRARGVADPHATAPGSEQGGEVSEGPSETCPSDGAIGIPHESRQRETYRMITQKRRFSLSALVAAMSLASLATVILVGTALRSQARADRKYVNLLEQGNRI